MTTSRGFIALTSAILIAAVLLGITTTVSTAGYFARGDSLTSEFKRVSLGLAESCANTALLKFATTYSYAGNETIAIGTDAQGIAQTCKIDPVVITATTIQGGVEVEKTVAITVHGIYRDTYSDLTITSTIQNPASQTVNTMLTLYTILPAGADSGLFPLTILPSVGASVLSGTSFKVTPATAYAVSVPGTPPTGYTTDFKWIGDCDATGHITPLIGTSNSCAIYYALEPTTATMTVIVNVVGGSSLPADFVPKVDGTVVTSGSQAQYAPGTHTLAYTTVSGYTTSGFDCTATNSVSLVKGQTQVCVVTFSQPALACADTVLMLDRTGSMFYTDVADAGTYRTDWITDEETAANAFVALYKQVVPHPQLAIGRFADKAAFVFTPSGSAEILSNAFLQSSDSYYTSLPGIIHSALTNITSPVFTYAFTNLSAAVSKGYAELTSIRHIAGKERVLVLVSDGVPTLPSGSAEASATSAANTAKAGGAKIFTIHFGDPSGQNFLASLANNSANDHFANTTTAFLNPTAVRTPSVFTSPASATGATDGTFATNSTNNDRQDYGNFHVSVPSWGTVTGIEATVDAKATGSATSQTGTLLPTAQGSYVAWTNGVSVIDESSSPSCASSDSIISTGNTQKESVRVDLSSVPNGSTITSVQVLTWDVANSSTGGTYQPFVRVGGADTVGGTNTASSNNGCTQRSQTINITDFAKSAGSVLEVGVLKTGSSGSSANTVRVGAIRAIVSYAQPATCTIGVQLFNKSDANNWTSQSRTILLTGTEANLVPSGNTATDLWGRSWIPSDFTDANFAMRITNTNCSGGSTANINSMSVRVHYNGIDADAENTDGDNFFIAPTSADMTGVFSTIANQVCPAVAAATQAHLYVITNVINSDGGTKQASDFSVGVAGGSAIPSTSAGSSSGVHITLTPGASYSVTQTNTQTGYYAPYYSSSCSGSIASGESKTCVIVNDDIPAPPPPPPAPPPPSNINIGSWQQNP